MTARNTFKTSDPIPVLYSHDDGQARGDVLDMDVIFLGSRKVGKTSLIFRFASNSFSMPYVPTIGYDYTSAALEVDGKRLNVKLWDTAGDEKQQEVIARQLYTLAATFVLVFDITSKGSLHAAAKRATLIKELGSANADVLLLGNKKDLGHERQVSSEEGEECANKIDADYAEVSALTTENVTKTIMTLCKHFEHTRERSE